MTDASLRAVSSVDDLQRLLARSHVITCTSDARLTYMALSDAGYHIYVGNADELYLSTGEDTEPRPLSAHKIVDIAVAYTYWKYFTFNLVTPAAKQTALDGACNRLHRYIAGHALV